ncbi:hypothetical protein IQ07DRAFT_661965 [Pyrenochaeta sp. DS3sAY3a]|nr:hypothetical protein IQ07DRAFT_661965 [Pyrenochaeta sp. DS3sAY3a]
MATLDPQDLEIFTFSPVDVSALANSLRLPDTGDLWYTPTRSFTIMALIHFGEKQMLDFGRQISSWNRRHINSWNSNSVSAVPLHHDIRTIRSEIPNLTALGQDLLGGEQPDARLTSVLQGEHFDLPDFYSWVEEVYELHNTKLASSASTMRLAGEEGSMECGISAYCAALRIRLYLWRMAVAKRGVCPEEHMQQVEDEGFMKHCIQIAEVIAQEHNRNEDSIRWAGGRPRLLSDAIDINRITTRYLEAKAEEHCSICQDTHPTTECVTLIKCDYGKVHWGV